MTRTIKTPVLINADLGEGCKTATGACADEKIIPYIDLANIACGGHAGDEKTIRKTIALAKQYNVKIGAHPSYPDRENFGRKPMTLSPTELTSCLTKQLDLILKFADESGVVLNHIKPHGALYNQAAFDEQLATSLVAIFQRFDNTLPIIALANSALASVARIQGAQVMAEGFADRRYTQKGLLTSRLDPGAVIEDTTEAMKQAAMLIDHQQVSTIDQHTISIKIDTLCLHGDGKQAIALAKGLHKAINEVREQK